MALLKRALVLLAAAAVIATSSSTAEAAPKASIDVDAAFPVTPKHVDAGFGAGLRLGYEIDLLVLSLTPEIGASYTVIGNDDLRAKLLRGFVGGRLMFGSLVKPGIYAHIGYANTSFSFPLGSIPDHGAPTVDGGFALDLTFIPKIDLGIHVGYTLITAKDDFDAVGWVNAGVHAAYVF